MVVEKHLLWSSGRMVETIILSLSVVISYIVEPCLIMSLCERENRILYCVGIATKLVVWMV